DDFTTAKAIGTALIMMSVFCLLQCPAALALCAALLSERRWRVLGVAASLALLVVGSYLAGWIAISVIPVGQPISELWSQMATLAGGATLATLTAAAILRRGGYRLVWGKAADA
ncbi:MAG: hypothetical protein AAF596_09035, partial [Planctomycetota bacterium]